MILTIYGVIREYPFVKDEPVITTVLVANGEVWTNPGNVIVQRIEIRESDQKG